MVVHTSRMSRINVKTGKQKSQGESEPRQLGGNNPNPKAEAMHRSSYDQDVTVWSPQGRLHQVEYAMEAVKQGSAALGIRSKTHVVLAALRRSPNEFASYLNKLFKVDDHMGVAIAGLTADARTLVKHIRTEALEHEFTYSTKIQAGRLASELADMLQRCTQSYIRRPYGVGLLIAAWDATGSHLIEISPSGTFAEYYAMAIGARSQSAKTYMEKHLDEFSDCGEEELIKHALKALSGCTPGDKELDTANTCVMVVGEVKSLQLIDGDSVQPYLDAIEVENGGEQGEEGGEETAAADEAKEGGEDGGGGGEDDTMET